MKNNDLFSAQIKDLNATLPQYEFRTVDDELDDVTR